SFNGRSPIQRAKLHSTDKVLFNERSPFNGAARSTAQQFNGRRPIQLSQGLFNGLRPIYGIKTFTLLHYKTNAFHEEL
ncbi:MAG: hypothetical protein ABIN48_05415, partial [Ginsengibacter sp.]